jgi:hypothetical protein
MNPLQAIAAICFTLAGVVMALSTWVFEVVSRDTGVAVCAFVFVGLLAILAVRGD